MKTLLEPTTHAQLIDRLSEIQLSLASVYHTGSVKPIEEEKLDYAVILKALARTLLEELPACNSLSNQTTLSTTSR